MMKFSHAAQEECKADEILSNIAKSFGDVVA